MPAQTSSHSSITPLPATAINHAKQQWRRVAALAGDVSRSNNLYLHRESIRIAQEEISRIGALVDGAAGEQQVEGKQ